MIEKADLEVILERVHEWTRAADQKVSIFLAFQGVIIALLFPNFCGSLEVKLLKMSLFPGILLVLGISLLAFSVYSSTSAIFPRLKKWNSKKSIIYFGNISNFSLKEFKNRVEETSKQQYIDDLLEQIHISSQIATRKHLNFGTSIITFFLGIALYCLSLIVG